MTLIWIALAAGLLLLVIGISTRIKLSRLRRSGIYPPPGQTTMANVERLLKQNQPVMAIRCYREIHHCSLREAKEAIASILANK
ncbi:MAG: hypothetical protein FWC58_11020 [Desulfobulbus sp.]|nr:hypothetical protein [Desulfobulbus sp.]